MFLYEKIVASVKDVLGADLRPEFRGSVVRKRAGISSGSFTPTIKGMKVNPGTGNVVPDEYRGIFTNHSRDIYSLTAKGASLILGSTLAVALQADELDAAGYWQADTESDERKRVIREIVQRQGQPKFRLDLLKEYDFQCAVSGCDASAALEAAHLGRYLGGHSNQLSNGIILRSDLHSLFDRELFGIDPKRYVVVLSD